MSERRNLERMTKEGRGVIHTKWATDTYRANFDQIKWKSKPPDAPGKGVHNNAVREGGKR